MFTSSTVLLIWAVVLVLAAGLFAAADSAVGAASRARVDELVREGRGGAERLAVVLEDRPRHVNLLILLRLACEMGATVLVTVVILRLEIADGLGALIAIAIMLVVS